MTDNDYTMQPANGCSSTEIVEEIGHDLFINLWRKQELFLMVKPFYKVLTG